VRFSLIVDIERTNEATRRVAAFLKSERVLNALQPEAVNI
jgi:hypothetical protein